MNKLYCLDSNFFIEAWNKYYSPDFCEGFWKILNEVGSSGTFYIPSHVKQEIFRVDDELKKWLASSKIVVKEVDENVTDCLKSIYAKDEKHIQLVDSVKGRSLADPWIIAHAMNDNAIVVTKEEKITDPSSGKIKIPNVCENMGVRWITDFDFIREIGIKFSCRLSN